MSRKYDWGDGRKVHSRPATSGDRARNKKARGRKKAAADKAAHANDPYTIALDMATKAFAPAIKSAKEDIAGAVQHLAPGGALDTAYNRSGQSIANSQAAAGQVAQQTQGQANQAANFTTQAAGQLGADQVAYAQQQANLYGQTAKAAEVAAHDAGANVVQLGQAGQNLSGFLGALGSIQANLGVSQTAANESRRGEARTEAQRALQARKDKLAEVRSKRGSTASETAVSLAKDIRDFQLAEDTLGQQNTNSRRDYLATLAGIRAQGTRQDDAQAHDDASREDDQDFKAGESRKDRAVRLKAARIQARKGRDGIKGTADDLTPSQAANNVTARTKLDSGINTVFDKLTDGKSTSKEEVRKRSGMKPGQRFDAIYDLAVNRTKKGHYTIPRKHLPYIRSLFYGGVLPKDVAKRVEKK